MTLQFDLFEPEATTIKPPSVPEGHHRVTAWLKRDTRLPDLPGIVTLVVINDRYVVYEPVEVEMPLEWHVSDNGFGVPCFRRRDNNVIYTALHAMTAGGGRVVGPPR